MAWLEFWERWWVSLMCSALSFHRNTAQRAEADWAEIKRQCR
jgi:hypothetical protein